MRSLQDIGEIQSRSAVFHVESDSNDINILCSLCNATTYEKNVFSKAISELLSPIDNPRYLLIKQNWLCMNYLQSYACPSVFAEKKETAAVFAERLARTAGNFYFQYTRNEYGRSLLIKCCRRSYINRNEIFIKGKKAAISKWE